MIGGINGSSFDLNSERARASEHEAYHSNVVDLFLAGRTLVRLWEILVDGAATKFGMILMVRTFFVESSWDRIRGYYLPRTRAPGNN